MQFPHPLYSRHVLEHNFRDFQRFFLDDLLDVLAAHALMLAETGILGAEDLGRIAAALDGLDRERIRHQPYDGSTEDVFFYIDRELERLGGEAAGRLRAARSRNDLDVTLYRMQLRRRLTALAGELAQLARTLMAMAAQHRETVFPAHTHAQPAQPTTLAHVLLGVSECLLRDLGRLRAAFATVNCSPMGACAITTTGFPINRRSTMRWLGFDELQLNSYGAIAAIDYLAESLAAVSVSAITLGQFLQLLIDWSKPSAGFLRLSDAWVQISSIMPQKRNPVALEHARVLASRAFMECHAAAGCLHNAPFEDTVDREDDLMPLALDALEAMERALAVTGGALAEAEFDVERMRELSSRRFITTTELADTLVRREGLSFKAAHEMVAAAVREAGSDSPAAIAAALEAAAQRILGRPLAMPRAEVEAALDPWHFVVVRTVEGGPAPAAVDAQLAVQSARLDEEDRWWRLTRERLDASRKALQEALRQRRS
ncbi:MAG: argininosuccinate lyase [Bryobacteraceae bacterium]|nr:argininosuccinate lyase [Bryobacteraceae bacterium]